MGDVHGGLLKCVLQLAACSDKVPTSLSAMLHSLSVCTDNKKPLYLCSCAPRTRCWGPWWRLCSATCHSRSFPRWCVAIPSLSLLRVGMTHVFMFATTHTQKATLAVVPVSASAGDAHAKRQQFDDALAKGAEAAERLEMTKARLEKELRRRSDSVRIYRSLSGCAGRRLLTLYLRTYAVPRGRVEPQRGHPGGVRAHAQGARGPGRRALQGAGFDA